MPGGQDDPTLRLAHAAVHIEVLKLAVREFLDSSPFTVTVTVTENEREQVVTLDDDVEFPAEISLIAGDAIHSMRAALDNLVWQLGLTVIPEPRRQLVWPVGDRDLTQSRVRPGDKRLSGLPQGAAERVLEFQGTEGHMKWFRLTDLQELWKRDKHQTLQVMAAYAAAPVAVVVHPADSAGFDPEWLQQPSYQGAVLPGGVLVRLPAGVDARLSWEFGVAFGTGPVMGEPLIQWLCDTHRMIETEVFPEFGDFLPGM